SGWPAGRGIPPFDIGAQDSLGNPLNTGPSAPVALSFAVDPACRNTAGEAHSDQGNGQLIGGGAGSVHFDNVRPVHPGTFYLRASAPGYDPVCSGSIVVGPSGRFRLVVDGGDGKNVFAVGSCHPIAFRVVDSEGNPAPAGSDTVSAYLSLVGGEPSGW